MVTMTQIAERAGISQSTVSAILNGKAAKRGISQKRVDEVMAVANAMGYRPNAAAVAMKEGRFKTLLFLRSAMIYKSWMPIELLDAIEDEVERQGFKLLMGKISDDAFEDTSKIPTVLKQLAADGILMNYIAHLPEQGHQILQDSGAPAIWLNVKHEDDCVSPNDLEMSRQATRKILEAGHRSIAFMCTNPLSRPGHYSMQDRHQGYLNTMAKSGLQPHIYQPEGHCPFEDIEQQVYTWLQVKEDRPTAILCNQEAEAMCLYHLAPQFGLTVGKDLSIVTFNTSKSALSTLCPFTCFQLPVDKVGQAGVQMLLKKLENPSQRLPRQMLMGTWKEGRTLASI